MDLSGYGRYRALMRRLLLCVIGITALVACGSPTGQSPAASPAGQAPAATTGSQAAVSAPDSTPDSLAFSAARVGGGTINLADYAGKPVLLWFWAPT